MDRSDPKICTLALAMIAAAGCISEELPVQLIGTWVATSPSHQGRFIEITEEHIIFSSDQNHSIFYSILGIESRQLQGKVEYTIEYRGVGESSRRISLRLAEGEAVAIELANQNGIWVRKDQPTHKKKEAV